MEKHRQKMWFFTSITPIKKVCIPKKETILLYIRMVGQRQHGYIRGWVKTDVNGFYKFYTLVPASYPNSNNPKHIHPTIKEPGKTAYWIDEFVFDDDPLLPEEERKGQNRLAAVEY